MTRAAKEIVNAAWAAEVGLSLMTKDDVSLFANFPIQSFMSSR